MISNASNAEVQQPLALQAHNRREDANLFSQPVVPHLPSSSYGWCPVIEESAGSEQIYDQGTETGDSDEMLGGIIVMWRPASNEFNMAAAFRHATVDK